MNQDVGNSEEPLRLLQANSNVPPPHPGPVRVRSCLTTPRLPVVQAMGFIPPEQPNCQGKGLMVRVHEGPPARPLGEQPVGCYALFLFLSDGVSVGLNSGHSPCGWIVSTGLSVYQASAGISALPCYRLQGPAWE